MTRPSPALLALSYLATCIIWGSTYFAIKLALASFSPLFLSGARYAVAAVLGWGVARALGIAFPGPFRQWWPVFGVGILFITIANSTVCWAEVRLDSAYVALIMTTSTLWTAMLAPLIAGDPWPRPRAWLGIGIGLAGTVLLIEPWKASAPDLGAALAVSCSVIVWAAGANWIRRIKTTIHPFAMAIGQMAVGAAVLLLITVPRGDTLIAPITPSSGLAIGFLVIFGSLIAFGAYFYLLEHWDAAKVSTSAYVNPVIALSLGVGLLGERLTWTMGLGTVIVLSGVTLVLLDQHRAPVVTVAEPPLKVELR